MLKLFWQLVYSKRNTELWTGVLPYGDEFMVSTPMSANINSYYSNFNGWHIVRA